jgi:hypothetical protein
MPGIAGPPPIFWPNSQVLRPTSIESTPFQLSAMILPTSSLMCSQSIASPGPAMKLSALLAPP